ncbi:MAG: replication-associated recombination protein A, partial [Patescibacteria group bacterium]
IFASEDIGLAQPTALVVANDVFRAVEIIALPECGINLAAGAVYLCQCRKDRSAYEAYMEAMADVKKFGNLPIPLNLRNPETELMKELNYGNGYDQFNKLGVMVSKSNHEKYSKESFLPDKLKDHKYLKNKT